MKIFTKQSRLTARAVMRVAVLVLVLLSVTSVTGVHGQGTSAFTVEFKDRTIVQVIAYLQSNSNYNFSYNSSSLNASKKRITASFNKASLTTILSKTFENTDFTYEIKDRNVFIKTKVAQPTTKGGLLHGKIVAANGGALSGVSVIVPNTSIGTATNAKGEFTLNMSNGTGVVKISALGYVPQTVNFNVANPLSIKLQEAVERVDEVSVVAYGQRNTREIVGSISSVKADDIKELPAASMETLLQGRMAGVEVNNMSGSPGGGGSLVSIRGYNSLFVGDGRDYGEPLYVIDGVPMHSFTSPVTGTNTIAEIDPATIESVEVLKDAASAALYGSRAGNGVILITTKRGKEGKAQFSANVSTSYSILPEAPAQTGGRAERDFFFNAERNFRCAKYNWELGRYVLANNYEQGASGTLSGGVYDGWWAMAAGGYGRVNPSLQDSLNYFANNSTDWFKYAFRPGKIFNANIQASGGSEKVNYMVGAGYYNEKGIMNGSDFQRLNVIMNLGAKPAKGLSIDGRFYLAYTDRSRGAGTNGVATGSKFEALTVDPRSTSSLLPAGGVVEDFLLREINQSQEVNETYRMMNSILLKYEVIKGLTLSTSGSVDMTMGIRNLFRPSTLSTSAINLSIGEIDRYVRLLNENLITYKTTIGERNNIDFLLGHSIQIDDEFYNMSRGMGGASDDIHYIRPGAPDLIYENGQPLVMQAAGTNKTKKVLISFFGRVAYNFDKKYLAEFTLRKDGSSVFGANNRWGTFPSAAVGWALSEETFMDWAWWMDFGKLRASWGRSGQQFGQPYLAHGQMKMSGTILGNTGIISDSDGGMLNPFLGWELTDQYDIGIDFDLFNYRVKIKADYYYKNTRGLLYRVELPGNYLYHTAQWRNAMTVSNEGLELELDFDIFREGAVTWRTKFNISRNWNRFKSSYNGRDTKQYVLGMPLSGIFLYKDNGYYDTDLDVPYKWSVEGDGMTLYPMSESIYPFGSGMRRIEDVSNDGIIGTDDKIYAGNGLPLAFGGWVNEVTWNNFDLNALFSFSLGRQIYNLYRPGSLNRGGQESVPIFEDIQNSSFWTKPGDNSMYPQIASYTGNSLQFSGEHMSNLEKVNMVKLKQITLGYTLPREYARHVGMSSLRVFLTAENLFYLSNYSGLDPEVVDIFTGADSFSSYPLARKFSIGLTLTF